MAKEKEKGTNRIFALLEGLPKDLLDKLEVLQNYDDAVKFAEAGAAKVQADAGAAAAQQMVGVVDRVKEALSAEDFLADIRADIPEGRDVLVTVAVGPTGCEVSNIFARAEGRKVRVGGGNGRTGGYSTAAKPVTIDGTDYRSMRDACISILGLEHKPMKHHCDLKIKKYVKGHNLTATGID